MPPVTTDSLDSDVIAGGSMFQTFAAATGEQLIGGFNNW